MELVKDTVRLSRVARSGDIIALRAPASPLLAKYSCHAGWFLVRSAGTGVWWGVPSGIGRSSRKSDWLPDDILAWARRRSTQNDKSAIIQTLC